MHKYEEIAPIVASNPDATVDELVVMTKSSRETLLRTRALLDLRDPRTTPFLQDEVIKILRENPKASSYDINQETGIHPVTIQRAAIRIGHKLSQRVNERVADLEPKIIKMAAAHSSMMSIAEVLDCSGHLVARVLRDAGLHDKFKGYPDPKMTDEDIETLFEIYESEDGPAKAAAHFGITKNAAIGRYHRYKKKRCG